MYYDNYFCLVLIVSCMLCEFCCAEVHWRYRNLQRHNGGATTRDVLKLEVVDTGDNVSEDQHVWSAPNCTLSSASGKVVYLQCRLEGIHTISLSIASLGSLDRQIWFRSTYGCYNWYITVEIIGGEHNYTEYDTTDDHHADDHKRFHVWIYNNLKASSSELNYTALQPSSDSKLLTTEFAMLGQKPRAQVLSRLGTGIDVEDITFSHFNSGLGYWVLTLHKTKVHRHSTNSKYVIKGKPVALYNCFVKDLVQPFSTSKYSRLGSGIPRYHLESTTTNPTLSILGDAKQGNVAVVAVGGKLYITQDHLTTIQLLPAPEGMTSNLKVMSIALMYNHLVVLDITNKIYYLSADSSNFLLYQTPDGFKPTYIASQDWLIEGLFASDNLDLLAMTDGKQVWLSNNLQPAQKLQLPVDEIAELAADKSYTFDIHDVCFDIKAGRIGLAIKLTIDSENKIIFPIHDLFQGTWVLSPFWVDFKTVDPGKISMFFLGLAKTGFYFRNQNSIFYSYDDSSNYGMKRVCENVTELAHSPHYIRDVIVTRSGEVSVLLSNHQILYGKVKQNQLALFKAFHAAHTVDTVHWFDELNRLWLVTVNSDMSVDKLLYPLTDQLYNAIGIYSQCTYRYFVHNVQDQVYLLDKTESLTVWGLLVFREDQPNSIDVIISDIHGVMQHTSNLEKEHFGQMFSHNLTITIENRQLPNSTQGSKVGTALLELRPHHANLLCEAPNNAITYLSIGCPTGRRMKVRTPKGENCINLTQFYPNNEVVVKAGRWRNLTTGELSDHDHTFPIDIVEVGCPIVLETHVYNFKPIIDLYDYNKFVKVIEANFIVWDINGVSDYTYTHSLEEVACVRQAQTWQKMRELANFSLPPEETWTTDNYESCFVRDYTDDEVTAEAHDIKYEILNYSGPNQIRFHHDFGTLHVLKVRVIEKDYSFCNLTATFAVFVTGIDTPDELRDIIASNYAVLGVIIISLISTYIWFHRRNIQKQKAPSERPNFHRLVSSDNTDAPYISNRASN